MNEPGTSFSSAVHRPTGFAGMLALASGASSITVFAISALAPFIVSDLGISRARLGLLTLGLYLVAGLTAPRLGKLVDRFGGRLPLLVVFASVALGVASMAAAPSFWWIVAFGAVPGLALGISNSATNHLLSKNVAPHRQGFYMGVKSSGGQAAAVGAGLILPGLATIAGWRWGLAAVAILGAAGFFGTLAFIPAGGSAMPSRAASPEPSPIGWVLLYAFLIAVAMGPIVLYLPLYAFEVLGFSSVIAGSITAVFGGVSVMARLVWGRFADRLTAVATALFAVAVGSAVSVAVIAAAESIGPALIWLGVVGFGATAGAWVTLAMLGLIRMVELTTVGSASGWLQLFGIAGFLIGPIAFGLIVDSTGSYTTAFLLATAIFVIAGLVALAQATLRTTKPIESESDMAD